ncbi:MULTISPECIES: 3-carboxy-cis,cis-muconate cycloisomerase [Rhizobium/Agrobacterium group]|jgi:3-carboxy-cis,cis-muconate cycloisomerase|uniref:3-carboxy-cis,cis-muconate cycloisomerase n=1 Tax=Rhizobium/Agrobacterium group TaxID=227290 RepID=UPI0003F20B6E|nr:MULTISPECIES: 3-carboxy-cis,cis-muconate cycloisomerase [Rhizobium/Agrobacterium group]AHK04269.1 3-carboxy-cis,cis-muconate cycloisomerase [Agrobacterium tumefaciens LBA4213 (Ach5)]AKC10008.1 3-carboxy-cis,cis-muconate cycloisomerase [Agrobacterium tumefaciens]AYM19152.1 3-carboxy-cis,cis-muconate cycloisomerase [Agrobacterium tumefaciens]AYM70451.1 3-carboxy-cis,cis-muconate cycloisomerase [Agrobacterium tumefaciens]NIB57265.1 3-carboxy-cis,cis-muconate cycloisomerase [Agrobacterium tumef
MSLSPFEHPFLSGLFGDSEIVELFSARADIDAMIRFETALAQAQAGAGVIEADAADAIVSRLSDFAADTTSLRHGVAKDGVVVPELVRQMRAAVADTAAEKLHFGATSQDVIDTSLMLRLKAAAEIIAARLGRLIDTLGDIAARDGSNPLTGYTRMQAAIAITVGDRVASWIDPLERHLVRIDTFLQHGFAVQFGGAAGTLEKLGDNAGAVRADLAKWLGLSDRPQWHSQRDGIAELANLLSLVTGTLGKFGQDIALLAEVGAEIRMSGGGGSSAMPHKQNPVNAETLVTLARFNAVQISALHQSLVHEQERSGAGWMLEWLSLPQMVTATGSSLLIAERLAGQIDRLGASEE